MATLVATPQTAIERALVPSVCPTTCSVQLFDTATGETLGFDGASKGSALHPRCSNFVDGSDFNI